MHCRNNLLWQVYLFNADSESFAASDLLSWAADGPCSIQNLSWGYVLKVKRGILARMAEHGLVGGKLRKLKFECHDVNRLLLCAKALQVLYVGGLQTKRSKSVSVTKRCMKFAHVKGSSFCRQRCACGSNGESDPECAQAVIIAGPCSHTCMHACTHMHAHTIAAILTVRWESSKHSSSASCCVQCCQ